MSRPLRGYWADAGRRGNCARPSCGTHKKRQLDTTGLLDLALLYKRRQELGPSGVEIWQRLAERQCFPALEHLAKYYEHVRHDYPMALSLTYQLQTLEQSNTAHHQRLRRLVAKMPGRDRR